MSSPLANATIVRVDPPPTPSPSGRRVAPTPGPAVQYRCILDAPTSSIAWLIDDLELESTAVLYVEIADYPTAGQDLTVKGQVLVLLDGEQQPTTLTIDHVTKRISDRLAHVQLLLKEI